MNILLLILTLFVNTISKTIPHAENVKIVCDGTYKVCVHKSQRILVEAKYSNDANNNLQEYIKNRYSIQTIIAPDLTTIIINKPKSKLIYHGREIKEELSAIIYVPEGVIIK